MLTIGLIESLCALNRARMPEPLTHAKGAGARGFFIPYMPMTEYTKAGFLSNAEIETPVFVRFSRMMGRPGSADTARDVREFSVKFFTEEGIYDMVGSSLPVTFIRDPGKYPVLFKALSPCPKTNIHSPERLWQFAAENPEAMHMLTWLYSNRGTIKSYRFMEGHSVHTYEWKNSDGERYWVRYHWLPFEGGEGISRQEAEFLAGYDPDAAARDLYEAIEERNTVKFELCVQLISTSQGIENELTLLDPTVIWPESSVPWIKVGRMILNEAIDNYSEEIEKCSFSPGRLVSGINLSPEPMLQAMAFLAMDREGCGFNNMDNDTCSSFQKQKIAITCSEERYIDNRDLLTGQLSWRLRSLSDKEKSILVENMGMELLFAKECLQSTIIRYLKEANEDVGTSLEKWLGIY